MAYNSTVSSDEYFIHFRNPHMVTPVVVQMFMVLAAALVVVGLIYVVGVVIIISIHHVLYDRDPKKIPAYVKRCVQFSSSDSDDSDGDDAPAVYDLEMDPDDSTADENVKKSASWVSSTRKANQLDLFLTQCDMDHRNS